MNLSWPFSAFANYFSGRPRPPAAVPRTRGYAAAGYGGRWSLGHMTTAPASELHNARGIVTPRINWLVDNTPHARSAVNQIATSLIGDGPSARSKHKTAAAPIEARWDRFWTQPDADGVSYDLGAFATRAVRSYVRTGEFLVVMLVDPRMMTLQLRLLNPDQLDATKNVDTLPNGGRTIAGVAPPGYDVTAVQPPRNESAVQFLKSFLRGIAAGIGIPYEMLSGDLEGVNYSSAKLGHETFRRRCDTIRRTLLVPKFFGPVWRRFLTLEVLAGRFEIPGFYSDPESALDVEFLWTAWASLDPEKDANATIANINAGIQSRFESIAARGRDPVEVLAEIERDRALAQPVPVQKPVVKSDV
jgi:capsid protein